MTLTQTDPTPVLGRQLARRWRRPGPAFGRPRPAPIGSVAQSATRFVGSLGRPVMIRRMLAGPSMASATNVAAASVRPPRWWNESAVFAQERVDRIDSAVFRDPRRGLTRVVRPMPEPSASRPQGAWVTTQPKVVPMRLPQDVAAVGTLTTSADTAARRVVARDSASGPIRGTAQSASGVNTSSVGDVVPHTLPTHSRGTRSATDIDGQEGTGPSKPAIAPNLAHKTVRAPSANEPAAIRSATSPDQLSAGRGSTVGSALSRHNTSTRLGSAVPGHANAMVRGGVLVRRMMAARRVAQERGARSRRRPLVHGGVSIVNTAADLPGGQPPTSRTSVVAGTSTAPAQPAWTPEIRTLQRMSTLPRPQFVVLRQIQSADGGVSAAPQALPRTSGDVRRFARGVTRFTSVIGNAMTASRTYSPALSPVGKSAATQEPPSTPSELNGRTSVSSQVRAAERLQVSASAPSQVDSTTTHQVRGAESPQVSSVPSPQVEPASPVHGAASPIRTREQLVNNATAQQPRNKAQIHGADAVDAGLLGGHHIPSDRSARGRQAEHGGGRAKPGDRQTIHSGGRPASSNATQRGVPVRRYLNAGHLPGGGHHRVAHMAADISTAFVPTARRSFIRPHMMQSQLGVPRSREGVQVNRFASNAAVFGGMSAHRHMSGNRAEPQSGTRLFAPNTAMPAHGSSLLVESMPFGSGAQSHMISSPGVTSADVTSSDHRSFGHSSTQRTSPGRPTRPLLASATSPAQPSVIRRKHDSLAASGNIAMPTNWAFAPPRTVIKTEPGTTTTPPARSPHHGNRSVLDTAAARSGTAPIVRRWNPGKKPPISPAQQGTTMIPDEFLGHLNTSMQGIGHSDLLSPQQSSAPTRHESRPDSLDSLLAQYVPPIVDERIAEVLEGEVRRILDERIEAETERRAWRYEPGVF